MPGFGHIQSRNFDPRIAKNAEVQYDSMPTDDRPNINYDQSGREVVKPKVFHKNAIVEQMDKRTKARALIVTTIEFKIKKQLRLLGLPITLFGEQPENRRDRLRYALIELTDEERMKITGISHSGQFGTFGDGMNKDIEARHTDVAKANVVDTANKETWYHEGVPELYLARLYLAEQSIPAAKRRIRRYRALVQNPDAMAETNQRIQTIQNEIRESVELVASQVADKRPISSCKFSPDNKHLLTTSWTGNLQCWNVPSCKKFWESDTTLGEAAVHGHQTNVGDGCWNPLFGSENCDIHFASCSFDGDVKLWNLEQNEPIADLGGHEYRVSRLCFHQSGRFLATSCHDYSWRLWDLEAGEEILHQEGHTRAVFQVKFHPDGGVAATVGHDGYGRLWDLRTGRCIMFLEGHSQELYDCDFNCNGVQLSTASGDNTVKIWDMRQTGKAIKTLPAHHGLVTRTVYQKSVFPASNFMASAGYDKTVKVWSAPGYVQLREISLTGKVMGLDVSNDSKWLAASCYDKTFKLWTLINKTSVDDIDMDAKTIDEDRANIENSDSIQMTVS